MDPEWTDGFQPCAKDPTRCTCAVCKWQRFVAKFLITYIRVSLNFLANLDAEELERRADDGDAQPGLRALLDAAAAVVV